MRAMRFFGLNWFDNTLRVRCKAMSLYKRGMKRARKHDHQGAIDDYTAAIVLPNAPADVKAMAQYNRALVHMAAKEELKAIDDLNGVIAMKEELTNVKTMARQKLMRIERRSSASGV
jgi:hypothetical protein